MQNIILYRTIFTVISCTFIIESQCQISNNKLLEAMINDSEFRKYVWSPQAEKLCDTIYVIDTANFFTEEPRINSDKKIIISKKVLLPFLPVKDFPPIPDTANIKDWRCKCLFITGIKISKKSYRIEYLYAGIHNTFGFVEYKYRKKKLIKTDAMYGVY